MLKLKPKDQIEILLKMLPVEYVREHKFLEDRQFKFDWAIPSMKIGIEYEGLVSKKSRHTTITGYSKDCQKYNLAQINGWVVLRYTVLNFGEVDRDIKLLINK